MSKASFKLKTFESYSNESDIKKYLEQVKNENNYIKITSQLFDEILDEGFVDDLEEINNKKYTINDFVYFELKISETDKKGLINFDDIILNKFNDFDWELKELQEGYPTIVDFIDYDNGKIFIIKLK